MTTLIKKKYLLEGSIGSGSFGEIWKASNIITGEKVAIKIEEDGRKKILKRESTIIKYLEGIDGIPKIRNYFIENGRNYMIIDLLGSSLGDLKYDNGCFSLETTLKLGYRMITILESIHKKGIIHRDIKPDNFLLSENKKKVFLIDFGLSKHYCDNNGNHNEIRDSRKITGTVRYLSTFIHEGIEPSRRDDLISLCYILIYFLINELPWQGLKANDKISKFKKINDIKKNVPNDVLCKGLPKEFCEILNYCYNLEYSQTPNYNLIILKLKDVGRDNNINITSDMDELKYK